MTFIAIKNNQLCDISQNPHILNLTENTCTLIPHNNSPKKHHKKGHYSEATYMLSYQCFTVDIQTNISLEVTRLIMTFLAFPPQQRKG